MSHDTYWDVSRPFNPGSPTDPILILCVGHNADAIEIGFLSAGLLVTAVTAYTYRRLNGIAHERDGKIAPVTDLYVL